MQFEVVCQECSGNGKIPPKKEGRMITQGFECGSCLGSGYIPNETGNALLRFLSNQKRRLRN